MQTKNLATLYDLPPMDWSWVEERLSGTIPQAPDTGGPNRHTCWLTTLNDDGSPHTTAFGMFWRDGHAWLITGRTSRKGRNVERDPRCTLAIALHDTDVVIEGEAHLVTDPAIVAGLAQVAANEGWPARPDDSGEAITADYSAPSAGPAPWHVYRIDPRSATALRTTEPGGATRWTF